MLYARPTLNTGAHDDDAFPDTCVCPGLPAPAASTAPRLFWVDWMKFGLSWTSENQLYETPTPTNGRSLAVGALKYYWNSSAGLCCRTLFTIGLDCGSPRLCWPSAPAGPAHALKAKSRSLQTGF